VQRYQQRISGPLMDRIDIHLEMARVPFAKLSSLEAGEASAAIRARVEAAREVQRRRFGGWQGPGVYTNGRPPIGARRQNDGHCMLLLAGIANEISRPAKTRRGGELSLKIGRLGLCE
jgi:magnesium chelatase family protein